MIYLINPEIAEISSEDKKLFEVQKNLFTVSRHIRMNNLLSKALEEMRWHDQPRTLFEMYLLKMSEPYYNVGELINKIAELEKKFSNGENIFENVKLQQVDVKEKSCDIVTSADLISIWSEISSEIIKKHPLTAQSLKKAIVKVTDNESVELFVSGQFDYECVIGFQEQITKLFQRKTGLNIKIKVVIEKNLGSKQQEEDIVIKEEIRQPCIEYSVEEDLKETAKTAIPKHIDDIAKKFNSTAKKIMDNSQI
jgi:DNA polymerase-3 subunit gamma/tau